MYSDDCNAKIINWQKYQTYKTST